MTVLWGSADWASVESDIKTRRTLEPGLGLEMVYSQLRASVRDRVNRTGETS